MTREEASFILANIDRRECDDELNEALDMAIKSLEQEPVLDKIRAEIDEQCDRVRPYNRLCAEGLEVALGIIDKYKESED